MDADDLHTLARIERWVEAGGIARVIDSDAEQVTIALCRCDAGEEIERVTINEVNVRRQLNSLVTDV